MAYALFVLALQQAEAEAEPWATLGRVVTVFGVIGGVAAFAFFIHELRKKQVKRNALRIQFVDSNAPPYYVEQVHWSAKGHHATRKMFCIGVLNQSDGPVTARLVVESMDFDTPIGRSRPERALQLFGAEPGQVDATVQPRNASVTFYEFVEVFDDSDMVFVCYAQPINECYIGHYTRVHVRVEGGESVARKTFGVRTRGAGGRPMPFSVKLLD